MSGGGTSHLLDWPMSKGQNRASANGVRAGWQKSQDGRVGNVQVPEETKLHSPVGHWGLHSPVEHWRPVGVPLPLCVHGGHERQATCWSRSQAKKARCLWTAEHHPGATNTQQIKANTDRHQTRRPADVTAQCCSGRGLLPGAQS